VQPLTLGGGMIMIPIWNQDGINQLGVTVDHGDGYHNMTRYDEELYLELAPRTV